MAHPWYQHYMYLSIHLNVQHTSISLGWLLLALDRLCNNFDFHQHTGMFRIYTCISNLEILVFIVSFSDLLGQYGPILIIISQTLNIYNIVWYSFGSALLSENLAVHAPTWTPSCTNEEPNSETYKGIYYLLLAYGNILCLIKCCLQIEFLRSITT